MPAAGRESADQGYRATLAFPSEQETVITREFNAPAKLVFEALTSCQHIQHWYGPRRTTMTSCTIDLRPGGAWRYVMRDASGPEFAFRGVFKEITPHSRLVSTEEFEGMPGTEYLVTATLVESGGKTRLMSHLLYQSAAHRDGHLHSGMEGGMNESFDRLDERLATMA